MKVERECKIVSKEQVGDAVYMTLEVGDMIRASFRAPGQFVHIRCGEGLLLRRPISVCSCMEDEPDDLLSIVFEVRGEGTRWLAGRELGDSLDVLGLAGNGFDLKPEGPLPPGGWRHRHPAHAGLRPVHRGKGHRHPGRPLPGQDYFRGFLPGGLRQGSVRH